MKKILGCFALAFAAYCMSSSTAVAATCAVNTEVLTAGFSCTLGGLTFSNFSSNTTNPLGIDIGAVDPGNPVGISFNPNLPYGAPPVTDTYLQFKVTGGITGVSLSINGVAGSGVNENVCAVQQSLVAMNLGTCSAGNILAATFSATPGNPNGATFALAQTAWIFKDIQGGVGLLSEVNQGYASTVPEPMTLSMMGVGLLGLGVISRRRKKS